MSIELLICSFTKWGVKGWSGERREPRREAGREPHDEAEEGAPMKGLVSVRWQSGASGDRQGSDGEHIATAMVHALPARVKRAWLVSACEYVSKAKTAVRLHKLLGRRGREACY